jgi:hypothetical protein
MAAKHLMKSNSNAGDYAPRVVDLAANTYAAVWSDTMLVLCLGCSGARRSPFFAAMLASVRAASRCTLATGLGKPISMAVALYRCMGLMSPSSADDSQAFKQKRYTCRVSRKRTV